MESNRGVGLNRCGRSECNNRLTAKQIRGHKKFCSHVCYSRNKIGKSHSWGGKISIALTGKPKTRNHIEKVRLALKGKKRPEWSGENHWEWKGALVSYETLHDWVSRHKGRPKQCEMCDLNDPNRKYHWANISGEYKRDLDDFIRLCVPCHKKLDLLRSKIKRSRQE